MIVLRRGPLRRDCQNNSPGENCSPDNAHGEWSSFTNERSSRGRHSVSSVTQSQIDTGCRQSRWGLGLGCRGSLWYVFFLWLVRSEWVPQTARWKCAVGYRSKLVFQKRMLVCLRGFRPFCACLSLVFEFSTYLKIWILTFLLCKGISLSPYS